MNRRTHSFGLRTKSFFAAAAALWFVVGICARAQFYAPDTEFHDIAQRTFVVELARILAWLENDGQRIKTGEIKYQVSRTNGNSTHWTIEFIDKQGQASRTKAVQYSDSLLNDGPAFFRTVL